MYSCICDIVVFVVKSKYYTYISKGCYAPIYMEPLACVPQTMT